MSIRLHAINLIVPTHLIESRYPGGLRACIDDHESLIGDRVWFDAHLWRDGAPNRAGVRELVDGWIAVGLRPVERADLGWRWQDLCVVTASRDAPTLPCDWLRLDAGGDEASWALAEPGACLGPEHFVRAPVPRRLPRRPDASGWGRRMLQRLVGTQDGGLAPSPRRA